MQLYNFINVIIYSSIQIFQQIAIKQQMTKPTLVTQLI